MQVAAMAGMSIPFALVLLLTITLPSPIAGRVSPRQLNGYSDDSPSTGSSSPSSGGSYSPPSSGSSPSSGGSYSPPPASSGSSPSPGGSSSGSSPSTPGYGSPSGSSPSGEHKDHDSHGYDKGHEHHHSHHHHHHKKSHSKTPSYGSPPASGSSPSGTPPTPDVETPTTYTPPPTPPYGSGTGPSSGSSSTPDVGTPLSSPTIEAPISSPDIGSSPDIVGSPISSPTPLTSPVSGSPVGGSSPGHGGGSCDFWKKHFTKFPNLLSGLGSLLKLFGNRAGSVFGARMTVMDALDNPSADGYSLLAKQGTTALLNSFSVAGFAYTPQQVRQSFQSALQTPDLALAQAALFEQANLSV